MVAFSSSFDDVSTFAADIIFIGSSEEVVATVSILSRRGADETGIKDSF